MKHERISYRYYRCTCADPRHYVHLAVDYAPWEDGDEDGDIAIALGTVPRRMIDRLKLAWSIIRGRDNGFDEVILSYSEAQRFYRDLGGDLARKSMAQREIKRRNTERWEERMRREGAR